MAYPKHALMTIGGTLGTLGEVWQCGVRFDGEDSGWAHDCEAWLTDRAPRILAWFVAAANKLSNNAKIGFVKFNNINPDGTYADPVTHERFFTSGNTGSTASQQAQIMTAAITWTTAVARGLAHKGRVYLPLALEFSGTSTTISTAVQGDFITCGKGLLTAATNPTPPAGTFAQPSVVSRGKATAWDSHHRPTAWGPGVTQHITGVQVGSVMDVQRRRKEQIAETFTASAWP